MLSKSTKKVNVERAPEGQTLRAPSQHGCLLLSSWLLAEVKWVEEGQPKLVPLTSWQRLNCSHWSPSLLQDVTPEPEIHELSHLLHGGGETL